MCVCVRGLNAMSDVFDCFTLEEWGHMFGAGGTISASRCNIGGAWLLVPTAVLGARISCMRGVATSPSRMELEALPHEEYLHSLDFGPSEPQHLRHSGTGEAVVLNDKWRLDFSDQLGFLSPVGQAGGRTPAWCNDLLDWSLHSDTAFGDERVIVVSRASGDSYFADDVIGRVVVLGFSSRSSVGQFTGEMYKHVFPPNGLGLLHYWTIPFVQDFVWGSDLHNRWTCRHFLGWEFQLRKFGFMSIAEHMRRSVKSEMGVAKKRRVSEAGMLDFGSEQEFSLSTLGLFVALMVCRRPSCVKCSSQTRGIGSRCALVAHHLELLLGWAHLQIASGRGPDTRDC